GRGGCGTGSLTPPLGGKVAQGSRTKSKPKFCMEVAHETSMPYLHHDCANADNFYYTLGTG
ncbi:MAG: hypothetical protein ACP5R2_15015, partial [Anaerolineae bacterium]